MNVIWFRQDLRLSDNPALCAAVTNGAILPIYIVDDENDDIHKMGSASRWWLHHALKNLNQSLGGNLRIYQGNAHDVLTNLANTHTITSINWNRCYEPWRITRDKKIKEDLQDKGITVQSHNASLLWEPWDILKSDGTPYKVFTPYYRKGCLNAPPPREPLEKPEITFIDHDIEGLALDDLNLLPQIPWDKQLEPHWNIGEQGAWNTLHNFIKNGLYDYKEGRNFPAKEHVSRLSPYLHWGHISPHQIWHEIHNIEPTKNTDHFLSEIGWREFSHALLYHFPDLPRKNLQPKFNYFPWIENTEHLHAWQHGQTGYPIIDAGMRELWQTGYMHNRVRMIVGSFLVKNLLLHWHHGEKWFWDCLVDADLANNSASWQWIAGCGADAAPYFRIFNPVTQGEKFDGAGEYTRYFVPELKNLPDKYLFKPWDAPPLILQGAGVTLGRDYPKPIVDIKGSRERALTAFQSLKKPEEA